MYALWCPWTPRPSSGRSAGPGDCSQSRRTRACWVGEPRSRRIASDECFWDLDGPVHRITTPHVPLPAADSLEDLVIPSADLVATTVEKALQT